MQFLTPLHNHSIYLIPAFLLFFPLSVNDNTWLLKSKTWELFFNVFLFLSIHTKSLQLCLTLCDPKDCSPPGSSVHGILQARILEWVAISCSRGSSWPRDWTHVSYISCIDRWVLYHFTTGKPSFPEHIPIQSASRFVSRIGFQSVHFPTIVPASIFSHLNDCNDLLPPRMCSPFRARIILLTEIISSLSPNPMATSHYSWNIIRIPCPPRGFEVWYLAAQATLSPVISLSLTDLLTQAFSAHSLLRAYTLALSCLEFCFSVAPGADLLLLFNTYL